ncbi:di-heme-cytochrome C peroxidase [Marinobacterium rhizophilum]|uniref:di-heme-cytochrome C peroxidase n=1 Tax=Marinobacterium rhizophilum TaxID=420402 RepID=UPI00037D05C7|nr:di-heme-cytochrome C peroxidase [Marinobacterium rhizophilum]
MSKTRKAILSVVCSLSLVPAVVMAGTAPSPVLLDQGWDAAAREEVHHLSFGSRIVPYAWLLHLERSDSTELLRSDANLGGLGFIPTGASAANPDALPIGFSRTTDSDGEPWAGLTCAACHTGALSHQGQEVLIEGGAALIDFSAMELALTDAITATLGDAQKFSSFAARVQPSDEAALRAQLEQRLAYLQERQRMNSSATPYGHGRLDAFGQIFNTVAVELLGVPDNARPANAPVSFPFLWGAPHLDLVQWNGSAPNQAPGPLVQNVTTALAVYGTANLKDHSGTAGYSSSVELLNLGTLQDHFYHLQSPRWPDAVFGPLDETLRLSGETLYRDNCLQCHAFSDRTQADRELRATLVPLADIGTDATMARNFIDATAATGVLEGRHQMVLAGTSFGARASTVDLVVHAAIGATLRHPLDAVRASIESYHKVYSAQVSSNPEFYKARPLSGVWATAPYLHNGSVPNLHALLLPAEQRPASFGLGSRVFDPVKVGYVDDAGGDRFDTALAANGNGGHLYGTRLSEDERMALIEYLKGL